MNNNTFPFPSVDIANMEVVLYSIEQKCFHIETMKKYVKDNIECSFSKNKFNSFHIIGFFKRYEEASEYVKFMTTTIDDARTFLNANDQE